MLGVLAFPESPTTPVVWFYCFSLLVILYLFLAELTGKNLGYSKFWKSAGSDGSSNSKPMEVPSRIGMLIFYTPAAIAAISSFWLLPNDGVRVLMLKSAVALHFLKRDLEVLFLHKYSGNTSLNAAILISLTYFAFAGGVIYLQHQTLQLPEPSIDLKYLGIALFILGISGNLYHHHLLSMLRRNKDDKGYKIPRGGLFGLVICPHYLFEIITFFGISFISQTAFAYLTAVGSASYLAARSLATRKWYASRFKNFPPGVKALVPYVL